MKRIITLSTVLAFGATLALSSCSKKKDWTCKCTYDISGTNMSQEFPITDKTKKDAQDACNTGKVTVPGAGSVKCELK